MKLKRLISALIIGSMLLGVLPFPVFAQTVYFDVPEGAWYAPSLYRLSQLDIIDGYDDGTFKPGNYVTRAEFSKILISQLGLKDSVTDSNVSGIFTDVPSGHWANGYINLMYKKGYITGYGDGSFKPDDYINFAEALTLILRAMGYTSAEIGYHWPSSYIAKANALELTEDIELSAQDAITRADMVVIFDRALFADTNNSNGKTMFELLGYIEVEDVTIYATRKEDSSLASNEIKTNMGTYKIANEILVSVSAGDRGTVYVDDEGEIVAVYPDEQVKRVITVDTIIDKEIYGYENGSYVTVPVENDMTVYWRGTPYTINSVKQSITQGSTLTFIGYSYGDWDFALLDTVDMLGPVVVYEKPSEDTLSIGSITFRPGVKVYREDKAIALTDLDVYDVIYYVEGTNTIYAYNDKETGTYDEAYPNRATVTSISLSGVTYSLGTKTAISKLDADGVFDINDKITVLLGMNGEVVDVISTTNVNDYSSYVVVTNVYTEVSKDEDTYGKAEYYTTVVNLDCKEYTYKSEDNYESYKGYVTELNFRDGLMYLESKLTTESKHAPHGYVDTIRRMIGEDYVSPDAKIVEVNRTHDGVIKVTKVNLNEVSSRILSKENVIFCERDATFGDITVLVLQNFANSAYEYGYVSERSESKITIDIDGEKTTYKGTYAASTGAPVGIMTQNGQIISLIVLTNIASGQKIEAIDDTRIKVDGQIINIADDVKVYKYKKNSTQKEMITYDNLKTRDDITGISVYSDKALANGGKARVIVITTRN